MPWFSDAGHLSDVEIPSLRGYIGVIRVILGLYGYTGYIGVIGVILGLY